MCKFRKKWVLLKPEGSQGPPLARAPGPLGAQVSYYKGLGPTLA